jgi:hypothetical protein
MAHKVHLDISGEDLREGTIVDALAGRTSAIPPSAALSLLAEVDLPGVDRQRLLRDVLRNAELDPLIRAGAAQIYARVAGTASVPALLRALGDRTERVVAAVAAALGRVGTPDELAALRRLSSGGGGTFLRARAGFAEALITHRFGLTGQDVVLPPVAVLPAPTSAGALVFTGVRPGAARRDRVLSAITRDLPALDIGKHEVFEVQCGPRLLEIAVDRDFTGLEGMGRLTSRPAAPAVVVFQNQEHEDFYPGLIALSDPDGEDGVAVRLSRLSGDAVYVADGSVKGDELVLELRAVRTPGAVPVAARIRLTAGTVEISGISGSRATPAQVPRRA